jgi:hypothetical protein
VVVWIPGSPCLCRASLPAPIGCGFRSAVADRSPIYIHVKVYMQIRVATAQDAEAITAIYAPLVANTPIV